MKSEKAPAVVDEEAKQAHLQDVWLTRFSAFMGRVVPDAISTSVFMLVVLFISALAIGNSLAATMDAYYRGLWMLLPFTMQMTLVLVLGSVLGATPLFRRIIVSLSQRPRTVMQVIVYSVLLSAFVSYLNWGLALALGPLIAVHFASEAERRGIDIDFPFLLAAMGGAGSVWQFGLSASGPLMMATPGHFLEDTTGLMSLSSTIWSPAAIFLEIGFTAAVIIVARLLMPRKPQPISRFPGALNLAEPDKTSNSELADEGRGEGRINYSERMERYSFIPFILCVALAGWLYYHFVVKGASLDLNSLNTTFLLLCFLLHGNVRNFSQALQKAVVSCCPCCSR